jgi:hypothetical protein
MTAVNRDQISSSCLGLPASSLFFCLSMLFRIPKSPQRTLPGSPRPCCSAAARKAVLADLRACMRPCFLFALLSLSSSTKEKIGRAG